jgi:NitT/TauT family transport system permease protein
MFPDPFEVFDGFRDVFEKGLFFPALLTTLYHILSAFFLAGSLGTLIGIMMGRVRWAEASGKDLVPLVQTVPGLVMVSLAIVIFRFTDQAIIFIGFIFALSFMIVGVWQGTKNVDANLIEMARTYGHSERSIMRQVVLPAVFPEVISALRVIMGILWKVSLFGEYVMGSEGFGYQISLALFIFDIPEVFAWGFTVVTLMIVMEYGFFRPLEKYLMAWKKQAERA